MTELGEYLRRDISALSRAAGRLRARLSENQELADKLGKYVRCNIKRYIKMSSLTLTPYSTSFS